MKLAFLLVLFAPWALAAAPDEDVLGKKQGYPLCPAPKGAMSEPHCLVGMLSHYHKLFPSRTVAAAPSPRALKRETDGALPVEAFMASHRNTGLLVMKGDTILAERYQYERKPEHRFVSMSMAKTVVAMLVGIALHEKAIKSLDDPAQTYVAELKGHPYGETPIRHLLTMSSGVKFDEFYNGRDDVQRLGTAMLFQQGPGGAQAVMPFRERVAPAGQRFSYASSETVVLALVLRNATGRNLSEYLSEKIWQPMGAEADAAWNIDPAGYEVAYCCLSATLRDWGRFGLLLAEGGARDGKQIIPAAWLKEATSPQAPMPGYGYQTWVSLQADRFSLRGVRGQAIDIHPASRTVVVHTAVYAGATGGREGQYTLFNTVLQKLAH